jgi:hemerythrin-like domain-containing protein
MSRDVQREILADHDTLRAEIALIEGLLDAFAAGSSVATEALHTCAQTLYERFATHLALEERRLVPVLRELRGLESVERLARDHAEQRELLVYLMARLVPGAMGPRELVASDLRHFVEIVREDMAEEERVLLLESSVPPPRREARRGAEEG